MRAREHIGEGSGEGRQVQERQKVRVAKEQGEVERGVEVEAGEEGDIQELEGEGEQGLEEIGEEGWGEDREDESGTGNRRHT